VRAFSRFEPGRAPGTRPRKQRARRSFGGMLAPIVLARASRVSVRAARTWMELGDVPLEDARRLRSGLAELGAFYDVWAREVRQARRESQAKTTVIEKRREAA
jgi:hypothetical protein